MTLIRKRKKNTLFKALIYLSAVVLTLYILGPFLWMFISSISPEIELISGSRKWFPSNPTLKRYEALINKVEGARFRTAFFNSLIVATISTILTMFFGTLAAYCYARFKFKGKKSMVLGILFTQMLPGAAIVIPIYLFMSSLNLLDTKVGLILVYTGFIMPVAIWILKNYFISIPQEIEEAAIIDGATTFQILFRIIIPLVTPALFATGLYSFITTWNEFFFALILTGSNSKTIPVAITEFSTQGGVDYGMMCTAGVIGSIIPLVIAIIFKDYLVSGLTAGWAK